MMVLSGSEHEWGLKGIGNAMLFDQIGGYMEVFPF